MPVGEFAKKQSRISDFANKSVPIDSKIIEVPRARRYSELDRFRRVQGLRLR